MWLVVLLKKLSLIESFELCDTVTYEQIIMQKKQLSLRRRIQNFIKLLRWNL